MIQRCTNPINTNYKNYGGRGIKVCQRWLKFRNFLTDMGERPQGLTLERNDNSLGYKPGNCSWVTRQRQLNNKRTTVFIEHEGKRMSLAMWAAHLGVSYNYLYHKHRRSKTWP